MVSSRNELLLSLVLYSRLGELYSSLMARGWESKSVQEQQEEAAESSPRKGHRMSPDEAALFRQRQGLLLSRTAVLRRLETVQHSRQRKMLEDALAELDERLTKVGLIREDES